MLNKVLALIILSAIIGELGGSYFAATIKHFMAPLLAVFQAVS